MNLKGSDIMRRNNTETIQLNLRQNNDKKLSNVSQRNDRTQDNFVYNLFQPQNWSRWMFDSIFLIEQNIDNQCVRLEFIQFFLNETRCQAPFSLAGRRSRRENEKFSSNTFHRI